MSEVGWRPVRRIGASIGAEIRKVDKQIILPNGGEVSVRSADNPDSLRGEGLDFLVMDECAFIKEGAWNEALRPALSDRRGGALFISTPKGHNWFWRIFQQAGDNDTWQAWQFPTVTNPYIDPEEIAAARGNLPERIFSQEYMAAFIADAGGVFRHVMVAATAEPQEAAQDGHAYVMGVDWGKHQDFTVITVLDITDGIREVYKDRFNRIDYAVQVGRLKAICERFGPHVVAVERNSIGEPLVEQLQRDGLPIQPFITTNATKTQIIDALALGFERREIEILNDPVTIGELQAYEMERLSSGTFRYSAPAGMHDDTVMSLALAYHAANRNPPASVMIQDIDQNIYKSERRSKLWQP
jgi:hypothetical protein